MKEDFTIENTQLYDIHSLKETLLDYIHYAYILLGKQPEDIYYEEELLLHTIYKVSEPTTNTKEQFLEFLALRHMLCGICNNFEMNLKYPSMQIKEEDM